MTAYYCDPRVNLIHAILVIYVCIWPNNAADVSEFCALTSGREKSGTYPNIGNYIIITEEDHLNAYQLWREISSNGTVPVDNSPLIFWPKYYSKVDFTTNVVLGKEMATGNLVYLYSMNITDYDSKGVVSKNRPPIYLYVKDEGKYMREKEEIEEDQFTEVLNRKCPPTLFSNSYYGYDDVDDPPEECYPNAYKTLNHICTTYCRQCTP